MQNNVFFPKYTYKGLLDVLLISLGGLSVLTFAIWRQGFNIENFILLLAFIFFCFWWMHNIVRRIVFNNSTFSVTRFLLPTKTIDYVEITDIGFSKIKTKKGEISLAGMSNAQELLRRFMGLIEQGIIEKEQLEMEVVVEDEIWKKSIGLTAILSFPLCVLLFYVWPFYDYWFSALGVGISCGLIIYIVSFIIQRIQRKRLEE
jgi:hypothetical protein